jgi:GntR family transcriptional repressor for pyruvate dehydrogenase complex
MYEARRILEVGAAGLAAERATHEQLASIAEEVASLFAAMDDPVMFLVHDINFHRTVAGASGNPIVASLVEMVSELYYERRRETAMRATDRNLRDAAEMHRKVYQAIRLRDPEAARGAMNEHLLHSSAFQAEEAGESSGARMATAAAAPAPAPARKPAAARPRRRRGTT